jgi:hypothetical protein
MRVLIFSITFFPVSFLVIRGIERDVIMNFFGFHVNYPLFLSDFDET